jgi:hypothetical protein
VSSFARASDFVVGYEDGVGPANFVTLTYVAPVPEPAVTLLVCAAASGVWTGLGRVRRAALSRRASCRSC